MLVLILYQLYKEQVTGDSFKYSEAHRALLMKDHINTYFEDFQTPETLDPIEDYDWELIEAYENAMRSLVQAAKMFEGELYPTASSVPFLDTVFEDLGILKQQAQNLCIAAQS